MRPRPRCRALGGSVAVRMCKRQRGGTPMLQLFWFGRRLFQQLCEGSEASAGLGTRLAARLLLGIGIAIGLLLFPNPTNAATDVGGTIAADTVWTQAARPFVVSSAPPGPPPKAASPSSSPPSRTTRRGGTPTGTGRPPAPPPATGPPSGSGRGA